MPPFTGKDQMTKKTTCCMAIPVCALSLLALVVLVVLERLPLTVSGQDEIGALASAGVRPGDVMPKLTARTIDGKDIVIDFAGDMPSVLYALSPTCRWCERNHDNIIALATAASSRYRFVGISDDNNGLLEQYLHDYPLPFDVFVANFSGIKGLDGTPQTVVIGPDGVVTHAFAGVLMGHMLSYAEYVFDARLPGVTAPPNPLSAGPAGTVQ